MDSETILEVLKHLMEVRCITVVEIAPPYQEFSRFDYGLRGAIDPQFNWEEYAAYLGRLVEAATIVFACDVFGLHYAFFRNTGGDETLYAIGPWRQEPCPAYSAEWCADNLTQETRAVVERHYFNCALQEENAIRADIIAVLSCLYGYGQFQIVDIQESNAMDFSTCFTGFYRPVSVESLSTAELERRYYLNGKIFEAVARGDETRAVALMRQCRDMKIPVRIRDALRDRKNMSIIQNSLLRRELERVNVHPYYCDRISSKYYVIIDGMTSQSDYYALEEQMTREYCEYVRLYSLSGYSPTLQKGINYINMHLDTELSPADVAAECGLTQGYLSGVFKQETGQSLLQFIHTARIRHAAQRLEKSEDSIAEIAASVGIGDVGYFTRLFKREMGLTPSQYRKRNRR